MWKAILQMVAMVRQTARRLIVFVVGVTVVLFGIVMIVLPGPGTLIILLGLVILSSEFVWATWLLKKSRLEAALKKAQAMAGKIYSGNSAEPPSQSSSSSPSSPPVLPTPLPPVLPPSECQK